MKALAGFLAACALALAASGASADPKALAGVWLIEPTYFDPLVDQGLVTPEYPVLVIRADGSFTLYRVTAYCDMLPEFEEAKPGDDSICRRALDRARADLGTLASVSAAGRWRSAAEGRVQFDVQERGRTPAYFSHIVDAVRKDLATAAEKAEKELREAGARELRKLENFYTSAYVLHGAPLKYTRDGAFLRLEGEAKGELLVYRRVEPAVLQGAAGFVVLAESSAARYFRCLVDHLQRTPASGEQRELADFGRAAMADFAATLRVNLGDPRFAKLGAHPVAAPVRDGKLGAYLGCPARDQM